MNCHLLISLPFWDIESAIYVNIYECFFNVKFATIKKTAATYFSSKEVSSALIGLTSVFGMRTGEALLQMPPNKVYYSDRLCSIAFVFCVRDENSINFLYSKKLIPIANATEQSLLILINFVQKHYEK